MAEVEPLMSLEFPRFHQMITSPNTEMLGPFTSGDVGDIAFYKDGAGEYLLMCVHTPNEKIPPIWVRAERPLTGPDTIKFSYNRCKLWKPGDDDIMASAFATLNFRHVTDLLNIVHKVTSAYRMAHRDSAWHLRMSQWDSLWYAGVVIGILHGHFGKSWIKEPPPDWVKVALKLFGRKTKWATESVEHKFTIQHPNTKRISLMEPSTWKNEPTPLSQPPSSKQDDREETDLNPAGTKEKMARIASALTLLQDNPQQPHPMQLPNENGVVSAAATDSKKNSDDQPRGRNVRVPLAPEIDPSNVLGSNSLEEASTGIGEATAVLRDVLSAVRSPEAIERGPQASSSSTNAQPGPPGTPNLTGCLVRLGPTPMAAGGYSVWRGNLLSATSDEPGRALQVVIKVLHASYTDEDTLKRKVSKDLHMEMRIWTQLHHENVVRFLGHTEEPEGFGLVSISYPHGNVLSFLVKSPSVNREVICADVALGLQYLHEQEPPIIHGNLKGPNVLIDAQGRASICDFGLSIILDEAPTGHTPSNFGESLRFLAPELLEESTRTVETDIYAYACTCIAILFDQKPYPKLSKEAHLMRAIFSHQPPFELSDEEVTFPSFWRILNRCWDHDRTSRPPLNLIIDTIQRCLFRTYRTNLGVQQGIGRRVRFMGLPGIEQATLISLTDGGLSIVVNSSTSFHRVPIYQRYRWEVMDSQNLDNSEGDSDVSWPLGADHQYSPFPTFPRLLGNFAPPLERPPHVSKWKDYSEKFRLPYSLRVSYETYNGATLKMVLSMSR